MPNININAGTFDCQDPTNPYYITVNMGTTYRVNFEYRLNYSWNASTYDNVGLPTEVILLYTMDGQPAQIYQGVLPDIANNFLVTGFPFHDVMSFELQFIVGDPQICAKNEFINTADIVPAT